MLTQKACFNSPVWFNVGVKEAARLRLVLRRSDQRSRKARTPANPRPQCSACFINSVGDTLESILDLAKTEGMLFKWGSGTGTNLSTLREEERPAFGRRPRLRPAELHEGLRRLRRRDQERRQDAPRRQDGDPQRRSSRHRSVHLVQGQGREEGPHADRRGLRFVARRRSLQLHLLPERQQQRARHRRVHGSRGNRTATGGPNRASPTAAREALQGPRPDAPDRRSHAPVRRSRHAVRYHHQPLAHLEEHGAHQRVESLLGIHVPGRFGLQPGVAEPDEVRAADGAVRRRSLSATPSTP